MSNKQPTIRLQLSVLPRHLKIIEQLKEDFETNSVFIMKLLDTLQARHEKALSREVDHDN